MVVTYSVYKGTNLYWTNIPIGVQKNAKCHAEARIGYAIAATVETQCAYNASAYKIHIAWQHGQDRATGWQSTHCETARSVRRKSPSRAAIKPVSHSQTARLTAGIAAICRQRPILARPFHWQASSAKRQPDKAPRQERPEAEQKNYQQKLVHEK